MSDVALLLIDKSNYVQKSITSILNKASYDSDEIIDLENPPEKPCQSKRNFDTESIRTLVKELLRQLSKISENETDLSTNINPCTFKSFPYKGETQEKKNTYHNIESAIDWSLTQKKQTDTNYLINTEVSDVYVPELSDANSTYKYQTDEALGYEVREVWEPDLLQEMERRQLNDSSLSVPYNPAFLSNSFPLNLNLNVRGTKTETSVITSPGRLTCNARLVGTTSLSGSSKVIDSTPPPRCRSSSPTFGICGSNSPKFTDELESTMLIESLNQQSIELPSNQLIHLNVEPKIDKLKASDSIDTTNCFLKDSKSDRAKIEFSTEDDELQYCKTQSTDGSSYKNTGKILTQYEKDASEWAKEYCNGNHELHRKMKAKLKEPFLSSILHPYSEDLSFPVSINGKILDCLNLKVIYERGRTGIEEVKDFPIYMGMVIAGRYTVEGLLGEAAFSKALQCRDLTTSLPVCLKIIRNTKEYFDQSIDEIKILKYVNKNDEPDAVNCLKLIDYFYYREHLFIVTELLSCKCLKQNLNYFTLGKIQRIASQVIRALEYIHRYQLIHLDLKPENILMKDPVSTQIKVIDFGSSCFTDDHLSFYVQSRAPEVILGLPYDQKLDMWSLGCILAELWTGNVLFKSESVAILLTNIVGIIGKIPLYLIHKASLEELSRYFTSDGQIFSPLSKCSKKGNKLKIYIPKISSLKQRLKINDEHFLDFLIKLLEIDPAKRLSASEAYNHPWLQKGRYPDGL